MFQSDDAPDLLRAFDRRDYLLSEAGQFEDSQARAQDEEHSARAQDEATAWRRSLSAGDTIPGEDAYDFAAMARDGVWPKPDGSGRVPLSPRYWKPGRLVVAGHDLATGRRVLSSAPLEERVLGDLPDETDADTIEQILAQAKPEDLAELSGVERNSLEAWAESHGLMLAQGGTQATQTDITNGTIGPIPRNQVQEVVGRLGSWIQRLATELDKAGISIPTPLENDPRISLKDITVGDLGKVLEDISYGFWPISGGNAATGGVGTFGLKTDALEVMNAAPAVGAAGKVMKKGAEALAPTAKEMVRGGVEKLVDSTGGRMMLDVHHGTPHEWPPEPGFPNGRPRLDKVGEGEGAQAYGWGFYTAEAQKTAEIYHKTLSAGNVISDADLAAYFTPGTVRKRMGGTYDRVLSFDAKKQSATVESVLPDGAGGWYSDPSSPRPRTHSTMPDKRDFEMNMGRKPDQGGAVLRLDVPDDVVPRMLDWDKPLSAQDEFVRKAVAPVLAEIVKKLPDAKKFIDSGTATGKGIYGYLEHIGYTAKEASGVLRKAGIPGLRYLDATSRTAQDGTRNYVIWDQRLLDDVARRGIKNTNKPARASQTAFGGMGYTDDQIRKARQSFLIDFGSDSTYRLSPDYEFVDISRLTPTEKINEEKVRQIMRAMEEDGNTTVNTIPPIVVDSRGAVLDGHHRVEAARRLGFGQVPVFEYFDRADGPRIVEAGQ